MFKFFSTILLYCLLIIAVGIVGKAAFFPVHVMQKEIQTGYGVIDKTISADNAIYNYEWFKQTNEDISAIKRQYDNALIAADSFTKNAGPRKDWTFEDKNESSRLESVKLGLQNNLEQIIANYNARASMANRNIFINGLLPNVIDAGTFIFKN